MAWKDWSYWLKGGIITLALVIILVLIGSGLEKVYGIRSDMGTPTMWIFIIIPSFPLLALVGDSSLFSFLSFPYLIFFYFLIGALIGWIYGKIRGK